MTVTISAKLVQELRLMTDAAMMDCKKALLKTGGDLDAAVLEIRKNGLAKAEKKVDRLAAEGVVTLAISADNKDAIMIEINSETDFVARDSNFLQFAEAVGQTALAATSGDLEHLKALKLVGTNDTVEVSRQHLIVKIGENIQLRRMTHLHSNAVIGAYLHGSRIGVLVALSKGDVQVAKDIAMHVAASRPLVVKPEDVSPELIARERSIFEAQAKESGKPAAIVEKMIDGRIQKFLSEVSLLNQPFVKNPDVTVAQYLKEQGAEVASFVRFEVGEGLEKGQNNFVEEVMAQVREKS